MMKSVVPKKPPADVSCGKDMLGVSHWRTCHLRPPHPNSGHPFRVLYEEPMMEMEFPASQGLVGLPSSIFRSRELMEISNFTKYFQLDRFLLGRILGVVADHLVVHGPLYNLESVDENVPEHPEFPAPGEKLTYFRLIKKRSLLLRKHTWRCC